MNTPVCDFVKKYSEKRPVRLHMPGHKGVSVLGPECLDITEIDGADVLYGGDGIIAESEANAAALFGTARTLYSTEGSSLCIRAMLYLVKMLAISKKAQSRSAVAADIAAYKKPVILAGRNAHKTFITAAALLDIDVKWLYSDECCGQDVMGDGIDACSSPKLRGESKIESYGLAACRISAESLEEEIISCGIPDAVYITSPDYLGNIADISGLSAVCRKYGCLLLVDNAHGAYLKFIQGEDERGQHCPRHPMDLGADICCDSAHKTLPVLTGGAYLHIAWSAPEMLKKNAEHALKMFASTSPSYLIMQSLDMANKLLAEGMAERIREQAECTEELKKRLKEAGFTLAGDEPLKITICAKAYGYYGTELAALLEKENIYCEFSDPDYLVLMVSAFTSEADLKRVEDALLTVKKRDVITELPPKVGPGKRSISIKEAMLSQSELIDVDEAEGRVLAAADVACPPAIPIAVSGEIIDAEAVRAFKYYGINKVAVII
ncbi:MAG: amino acid decarboxylase [Eubacteriales bacterium]|nr:amino acid decarboxylase [Eubacteriales bacterium]